MHCQSSEEENQLPDASNPVTPTKSLRNYGAGHESHDNTDAISSITKVNSSSSAESDDDEGEKEYPVAPKKRTCVLAQYVLIK
jgi:hypothetical protein